MTQCPLCDAEVRRVERRSSAFGNRRVMLMVPHDVHTSAGDLVPCAGSELTYDAALELRDLPERGAA